MRVSVSELAHLAGLPFDKIKNVLAPYLVRVGRASYVEATPEVWHLLVESGARSLSAYRLERVRDGHRQRPRREVLGFIVEDYRGELDASDKDFVTDYDRIVYGA